MIKTLKNKLKIIKNYNNSKWFKKKILRIMKMKIIYKVKTTLKLKIMKFN